MVKKYLQVKSVYYYLDMTKIRVVWALTAKNEVALAPDKIFEN